MLQAFFGSQVAIQSLILLHRRVSRPSKYYLRSYTYTGVKDVAGNAITTTKTWSFTTSAPPDTTPPTVLEHNPS